jgi:plastocyanin
MRVLTLLLLGGCCAVAAAGCGGKSSPADHPAPLTQAGGSAGKAKGTTEVDMKNIKFVPQQVSVPVGSTIHFVNQDSVQHDVVATSGATFHSPLFGKGGHFDYKATKAGTIDYVCTVHPGMDGKIIVTG